LYWLLEAVQVNSIEATVNSILREWRDLWPGGLRTEEYSTLNLLALCRQGPLGYNHARCQGCRHPEWYASSCGNRHCPNCLGPRQAQWSEKVCERLPDCPHFHVVFTVPEELHDFFQANYKRGADILFKAATETLKLFQKNNWRMETGFLAVLHTWGSQLNWHPHLHVLVSSGGRAVSTDRWHQARPNYLFPVKSMSKVFGAIMLRCVEELESDRAVKWPQGIESLESRRDWRLKLAGRNWNIFSRATLSNTRAVVRYLARYTSRIAISNQRIKSVDEEKRTVSFEYKDYRDNEQTKETTLPGAVFLRRLSRHLVPKGFRRVRYYGLLAGAKGRYRDLHGAPTAAIGEKTVKQPNPPCKKCGKSEWKYQRFKNCPDHPASATAEMVKSLIQKGINRFSLYPVDSG
jgi:hypothetical protein